MKMKMIGILAAAFLTVSCAGTSSKVEAPVSLSKDEAVAYEIINTAEVPEKAMVILAPRLEANLKSAGFNMVEKDKAAKRIEIVVEKYRMRHGANRVLFGAMAGSDHILSKVTIKDVKTDAVAGQFTVQSKNPTANGTAKGLIENHADKIVQMLNK